eukprot:360341-Chlamydomonas_euryale.AAC.1
MPVHLCCSERAPYEAEDHSLSAVLWRLQEDHGLSDEKVLGNIAAMVIGGGPKTPACAFQTAHANDVRIATACRPLLQLCELLVKADHAADNMRCS